MTPESSAPDALSSAPSVENVAPANAADADASRSAPSTETNIAAPDATPTVAVLAPVTEATEAIPFVTSTPAETTSSRPVVASASEVATSTAQVATSAVPEAASTAPAIAGTPELTTPALQAATSAPQAMTFAPSDAAPTLTGDGSVAPTFVGDTAETVTHAEAAALPELPKGEPPRALVPGAFLKLQYEIKQVLSRGMTNLYVADAGSYGAASLKLIAERETPFVAPVASDEPAPTNDLDQLESGAMGVEALSDNPLNALPERIIEGPSPTLADLKPQPPTNTTNPSLFRVPEETFAQEGRDYAVFDYFASTSLQDHREPTNDERYLQLMAQLCGGMAELEAHGLHADFSRDLLRVLENGELCFVGFTDDGEPSALSATDPMEQLRILNAYLLGRALSEERTARLDDPFGALALSDEVKAFATNLENGHIISPSAALDEIQALGGGRAPHATSALEGDVGLEREVNEDSGLIFKTQRVAHLGSYAWELYVVADGMGGHEGGEVASERTLQALQAALLKRATLNWHDNAKVRASLLEVITETNDAVVNLTQEPKYMAMRNKPGATLCFALRLGARLFFGNVGDSRAYLWSAQTGLKRATKDHSYVQTLVDAGQITQDEAWDHPDGSIITAHMGDMKGRTKDVYLRLVKPGDKLLIVSDGVTDMLRDVEIAPFLQESDPEVVCRNLVDASNAAGGADNITALCVVFS